MFEGYGFNTPDKIRQNQIKYALNIPMAHAPGDSAAHVAPEIMRNYRSGGTPWTVIVDPSGKVVYNDFHIEKVQAVALIEQLLAGHNKSPDGP